MHPQLILDLSHELIVDNFCGGGGVSTGIYEALGRHADIAINHSAIAIAMHAINHPQSTHLQEDVFCVKTRRVTNGRPVGLVWLSPDCRHHSRAKAGKPVNKKIRGLAWVALKWAGVGARIIITENVVELQSWTRLVAKRDKETGRVLRVDGTVAAVGEHTPLNMQQLVPDTSRTGEYFETWKRELRRLGYAIEHKELCAADYGAPTSRVRLFVIARNDGQAIVWPKETHGDPRKLKAQARKVLPWRTAASCIDFTIPCPSIFLSREEARPFGVRRPLAEATIRRVGTGVVRYVVKTDRPYVVTGQEGLRIVPTLIQTGFGERTGQSPRAPGLGKPIGTIVAGGAKHAVVAAFLVKHFGGVVGYGLHGAAMHTITARDHHALGVVELVPMNLAESVCQERIAAVRALLRECGATDPTMDPTVAEIDGVAYRIVDIGMRMLKPREMYAASSFPESYIIGDDETQGLSLTIEQQIALVGNAVPPLMAKALVAANCADMAVRKAA